VSGPAPITTKVTLCAICHAELPFKALKCPSCGAPRTEQRRPPAPITSALQAAEAFDAQSTTRPSPTVGTASGFRFGIGFAVGALVIVAIAWLAIKAVQDPPGDISFDLILGSPTVATFSGSGSATSEPVRLHGDVDLDWTARPSSSKGCRMRAVLHVASTPTGYQVLVDGETLTETRRTQVLQALIDNDYVIEVASDCDWSFRFKRGP
jgi:hypothetical protein